MKILIVEDEEVLLRVLKEKFENAGFEVSMAVDGEAAMPAVKKNMPDAVVLDLLLPKKDGFKVLEEIKSNSELRHIPIIILSALGQDEDIKKAMKLGAVDYLVKAQHPINEAVEIVKNHIISKGR